MKEIVYTDKAPAPIGPYSQAVKAGGMLFISGQVAIDPGTSEFRTGMTVAEETRQVMENLKSIVEAAGYAMDQVVKCTIFLTDMQNFSAMNAVYAEYFKTDPPARETVAVSGLPRNALVEISLVLMN